MIFLIVIIYVAFIGLGLPDTIFGAAWPLMQPDLGAGLSAAGLLSIIVSLGTIVASLLTPHFLRVLGTGKLTAFSIGLTAVATFGYAMTSSFGLMCLLAIPMGIGAGAVDVSLNNFAALHLEAKHTNWLHASWGVGATLGPALLSAAAFMGYGWRGAYQLVGVLLCVIFVAMLFALPVWRKVECESAAGEVSVIKEISLRAALRVRGMKLSFFAFFFYAALEVSTSLWCGTYLVGRGFSPEVGAACVSLMFGSVMVGRIVSGFFAIKFSEQRMIHAGIAIIAAGCFILVMPMPHWMVPVCICLLGLGCSPVYPALIHVTPARFGGELSGRAIGIQMAGSYVGAVLMPPLFGLVASYFSVLLLPVVLAVFLGLLLLCVCILDFLTAKRLYVAHAIEVADEYIKDARSRHERAKRNRKKKKKNIKKPGV